MWAKITGALKSKDPEPSGSSSHPEVMSRVLEQHPNLSVFHNESEPLDPPPSPSKMKAMFKRISRAPGHEEHPRSSSPFKLPIGGPKKVKGTYNSAANSSQLSLATPDMGRRPSQDLLRPDSRASGDLLRGRASMDMLRNADESGSNDAKFNSVRSILREPHTPGTGQNVRFFSRDAYRLLSPDQSVDSQSPPGQPQPFQSRSLGASPSFLQKLESLSPQGSSTPAVPRSSLGNKPRPSAADIFASPPPPESKGDNSKDLPSTPRLSGASFELDLDLQYPPGLNLNFETDIPLLDTSFGDASMEKGTGATTTVATSTPLPAKGKGKERANEEQEIPPVDEDIFHSKEKSPRGGHDRSNSFSFGQTLFFSMDNNNNEADSSTNRSSAASSLVPSLASGVKSSASSHATDSPASLSSKKSRGRALSDAVLQSMLRAATKPTPPAPESDINDESSQDLVVYSSNPDDPDPFSANARTYYTPQTMIPTTPPRGTVQGFHARKTSKEENLIYSLQAELALQKDLCVQYESDLMARDELVDVLGRKLSSLEKEDVKRKGNLRAWKKKVADLERACRQLEEEVDFSRQDSLERSVMDEASSAALRMLHTQIAALEREKADWLRREEVFREEIGGLEGAVRQRGEEVAELRDTLWNRSESERELKDGILSAKEQMEMMGNVSVATIDEEMLKRLTEDKELMVTGHQERLRLAEAEWEEAKAELVVQIDQALAEKARAEEDAETMKQQLRERDEAYQQLKEELEAQWEHTAAATEKHASLEDECRNRELEVEAQKRRIEELEEKEAGAEEDLIELENRKAELENVNQELWEAHEEVRKERDEFARKLRLQGEAADSLSATVQKRDSHISGLEYEHQVVLDKIGRLETNLRDREADLEDNSRKLRERDAEIDTLRGEMNQMRREHARVIEEQNRALQQTSYQAGEGKMQLDMAIKHKAEADVEVRTAREQLSALQDEIVRLRRQVHELQKESADKEVKLVQANKQVTAAHDDNEGLNIALDSKQQELELLKRKIGVRGTAGSTPVQPTKLPSQRRDSNIFSTPSLSRPSSVISETGLEGLKHLKGVDTPSTAKGPALARTGRANVVSPTGRERVPGSMGPPPPKSRPSMTPTPAARISSLNKSSSSKPVIASTSTPRRTPSATIDAKLKNLRSPPSATPALNEDKENLAQSSKEKRRSMIPSYS